MNSEMGLPSIKRSTSSSSLLKIGSGNETSMSSAAKLAMNCT
jgi:hypothetical protein